MPLAPLNSELQARCRIGYPFYLFSDEDIPETQPYKTAYADAENR